MASYARSIRAADGTEIAYLVEGTGPALVLTNGLTTTSHFWKYLRPRWVERYTVVTWDLPGHGGSAPACTHHSARIESQPAILAKVMDDLGIARATHVGWSIGCQIMLEMYRQFPERCDALIALFGPAAHALSCTRMPFLPGARIYELLNHPVGGSKFAALVQRVAQLGALPHGPALVRRLGLIGRDTSDADLRQLITDLRQVDTVSGKLLACSAERHSAFDVLPKVRVPLLIVAGDKDLFAPAEVVGVPMHRAAPGSVLMRFEDATHSALLDHHEQLAIVIDDFLSAQSCLHPPLPPGEGSPPLAPLPPGEGSPPLAPLPPGEGSPPLAPLPPGEGSPPLAPLPPGEGSPPLPPLPPGEGRGEGPANARRSS